MSQATIVPSPNDKPQLQQQQHAISNIIYITYDKNNLILQIQ